METTNVRPETVRCDTPYGDIRGKVALITGVGQSGSSNSWGNGAAIARVLAQQGAFVFGCDLNLPAAERTQQRIRSEGGDITVIHADVTRTEDVQALVAACLEKKGRIDILVNNVGKSERGGPTDMAEEIWTSQIQVNLNSAYLCCRYVLPVMEKQGFGAVVNVSSIAGIRHIGKPQVAYSTCKAGLIQFTKTTAVLFAQKGIRLNTVVPGLIHTPLVEVLANKYAGGDYEGFVAQRNQAVPMGKMGSAFDVAAAVLFLVSDQAGYITGQELVVDGGITSSTP
jgi:NAD(P)-dependent dehydrogenase (short-subunit alcohol dehydrogenase family)